MSLRAPSGRTAGQPMITPCGSCRRIAADAVVTRHIEG
jgi:hypothetical protein